MEACSRKVRLIIVMVMEEKGDNVAAFESECCG